MITLTHWVMLAAILVMPLPARAQANASGGTDALRREVFDWLHRTYPANADRVRLQKITDAVAAWMRDGSDVQVMLGARFSQSGVAQMATTRGAQFRVFDLAPAQARAIGLLPEVTTVLQYAKRSLEFQMEPPPIQLSDLRIQTASPLWSNQKIEVTVAASGLAPVRGGRFALRAAYRVKKFTNTTMHPLDTLPKDGVVRFTVGPINLSESDVAFGPVPLFVDVMLTDMPGEDVIASNLTATLLDVEPDLEGYARAALKTMTEIIVILEGIRDRATALTAMEEYTGLALRNEALAEASERLGPFTKAQDEAFERKYGGQFDALTQRLAAQVQRLEQAPYAGPAFFDEVQKAIKPR